jgi:hypothetical protein
VAAESLTDPISSLVSLMVTTLAGLLREGSSQGAPYTCYGFLAPTSSTDTAYLPRRYPPQAVLKTEG